MHRVGTALRDSELPTELVLPKFEAEEVATAVEEEIEEEVAAEEEVVVVAAMAAVTLPEIEETVKSH